MRETTVRAVLLNAVYVPIIGFLTALAVAFVLTGGGNMVLWGTIGIGQLTIFVNFALGIADPVQTLARTISNFIATQANTRAGLRPCWSCSPKSPTAPRWWRSTAPPSRPSGKTGSLSLATSPLRT